MKKILVGIDGSEGANLALEKAVSLISENGIIYLIAVIPLQNKKLFVEENIYKKIRVKAQELIDNIKNELNFINNDIQDIIVEGDAAEKIIDIAAKLNVDLIVLGCKGFNKIGVYPIGSVANKVVQYSHKPVMVVR
jgi:nucleotide-binding universal stress UspA family protein